VETILNPFNGEPVGQYSSADLTVVRAALDSAHAAFAYTRCLPASQRSSLLSRIAGLISDRQESLAQLIRAEAGKPISLARIEAARAAETFRFAAHEAGARSALPLAHQGNCLWPIILEDVPANARIATEEAFGPVAILSRYDDFSTALAEVNASRYGLQAGVFTSSLDLAQRAFDVIDAGAVLINEVPTFRVENMPYGGVKDSGFGREGVRYAMEDMTEWKSFIIRLPPAGSQ